MSFLRTLGALRAGIAVRFISSDIGLAVGESQSESECASPPERSDMFLRNDISGRENTEEMNGFIIDK